MNLWWLSNPINDLSMAPTLAYSQDVVAFYGKKSAMAIAWTKSWLLMGRIPIKPAEIMYIKPGIFLNTKTKNYCLGIFGQII